MDWKLSEGSSFWFESNEGKWKRGGRVNPNKTDIDLEYWWQNLEEGNVHDDPGFTLNLENTEFEDPDNERTYILTQSAWNKVNNGTIKSSDSFAIAVKAKSGNSIICLAWNNASGTFKKGQQIGVSLKSIEVPLHKRYHVRGKIYLFEGTMEVLKDRIRKEMSI